jgi:hypothetical protein
MPVPSYKIIRFNALSKNAFSAVEMVGELLIYVTNKSIKGNGDISLQHTLDLLKSHMAELKEYETENPELKKLDIIQERYSVVLNKSLDYARNKLQELEQTLTNKSNPLERGDLEQQIKILEGNINFIEGL